MKNFKWIMIIIAAVTFVVGVSSVSWSADKMLNPGKTRATTPTAPTTPTTPEFTKPDIAKVIKKCPTGWHVDQVSTFSWSCKPNPITFFQCPEGYVWRWSGECTGLCESVDIPK